ncbi:MAG: endonuclease/exonuclease/phosphatase family protein [Silicimonas sp.]|nr:endonuclease/exonuclease/phosphatase family protein [Silicimonas sp.]
MGVSSFILVHARYRHGAHRVSDHREEKAVDAGRRKRRAVAGLILLALAAFPAHAVESLRVAFYHTELSRDGPGLLLRDILTGEDEQVLAVVRVVRHADPDVLVLGGIDWDLRAHALAALADAIGGYPHRFAARPNGGVPSGADLDGDGRADGPGDDFGYAGFAGQKGLAVLSRLPIAAPDARDFSELLWRDLHGALIADLVAEQARLSTTAHWDVPVVLSDGGRLNLLIWHATPPVFDGPTDRNGRRNHDEAAFWLRYLDGAFGPPPQSFVLLGAANLDPADSEGRPEALLQLLSDNRLQDVRPASAGGAAASESDGGVNRRHRGAAALDTVNWPDEDGWPGNLRVDYVLPSASLNVIGAGVLWPPPEASLGRDAEIASRHRLVWVDINVDP